MTCPVCKKRATSKTEWQKSATHGVEYRVFHHEELRFIYGMHVIKNVKPCHQRRSIMKLAAPGGAVRSAGMRSYLANLWAAVKNWY